MIRLKMKNYNIALKKEAGETSALSSGKVDKYEYLTGEEIFPSNKGQIINQVLFSYSPLKKAFEKKSSLLF